MVYIGSPGYEVCEYCSRMYNNLTKCPACGYLRTRKGPRETTPFENQRWEAGKYFADPSKEELMEHERMVYLVKALLHGLQKPLTIELSRLPELSVTRGEAGEYNVRYRSKDHHCYSAEAAAIVLLSCMKDDAFTSAPKS